MVCLNEEPSQAAPCHGVATLGHCSELSQGTNSELSLRGSEQGTPRGCILWFSPLLLLTAQSFNWGRLPQCMIEGGGEVPAESLKSSPLLIVISGGASWGFCCVTAHFLLCRGRQTPA